MDGTVKLFHLSNKRVLQTFVHCKPEAVSDAPADGSEMEAEEEELETLLYLPPGFTLMQSDIRSLADEIGWGDAEEGPLDDWHSCAESE
jgi:hypothetical protein